MARHDVCHRARPSRANLLRRDERGAVVTYAPDQTEPAPSACESGHRSMSSGDIPAAQAARASADSSPVPMIDDESPLRRLPTVLIPGQAMFFNAIRFSAEVLDAAMTALRPGLYRLAIEDEEQHASMYPVVMMLAWSVVDSANRLRVLLESMRRLGWIVSGPLFAARLRKLDEARALRDAAQHLDDHIKRALADDLVSPVWGSLAWAALVADDDGRPTRQAFSCILVPGSVVTTTLPVVNPAGRQLRSLVDLIELQSFGARVSL